MIHEGYERGTLQKKYVTRVSGLFNFFCNHRYLHSPHESSKKAFYCLYLPKATLPYSRISLDVLQNKWAIHINAYVQKEK